MQRLLLISVALLLCGAEKKEAIDYDKPFIGLAVVPLADFTGFGDLPKPPSAKGIVVTDAPAYGPAGRAGVTMYSVITTINARTMDDLDSYQAALEHLKLGAKVTVKLYAIQDAKTPNGKPRWQPRTISVTPSTRRQCIIDRLKMNVDTINDIDFVHEKDFDNVVNRASRICLYFSKKRDKAGELRLGISYVANDWIFVEGFIFKFRDKSYTLPANSFEVKRDNGDRKVWEWIDIPVTDPKLYTTLEEMAMSYSAKMRYTGDSYQKDRDVSAAELAAMRTVLDAYAMMGGRVPD